jgi:hypothetical protein
MKNVWGRFNRIRFLEEINFSLIVIAVLISFFAFTEGLSDRANLSVEIDGVILAGEKKPEAFFTNQKLHTNQPVEPVVRTNPGYWYHKGAVTGY